MGLAGADHFTSASEDSGLPNGAGRAVAWSTIRPPGEISF
jgi:hypothetical protein